jgi:hypothetical protein
MATFWFCRLLAHASPTTAKSGAAIAFAPMRLCVITERWCLRGIFRDRRPQNASVLHRRRLADNCDRKWTRRRLDRLASWAAWISAGDKGVFL